jgi:pyruvate formate lyase activating enzyme
MDKYMTTGLVFDIQRFSVHDGPGIRTNVFLKGCPLRCKWCCNPESQSIRPELRHRGSRCKTCLSCVKNCRSGGALEFEGAPAFDRDICDECAEKTCVDACPEGALFVSGMTMTVADVVRTVAADADFYRNSGGGVTFSGGEPFRQHGFLGEALVELRAAGIHAAVETCGFEDTSHLLKIEPLLDLICFDLKVADPVLHRRLTGRGNALIFENLSKLAAAARRKIVLRFPLIPGATNDPSNVTKIAAIASGLGISAASVVPYHPMGRMKYAELGRKCGIDPRPVTRGDMEQVFAAFESCGICCELA